jgi:hypothetical protein
VKQVLATLAQSFSAQTQECDPVREDTGIADCRRACDKSYFTFTYVSVAVANSF